MRRMIVATALVAALTTVAMAASVGELVAKCGDDAKAYCDGVGYGDAMTECLAKFRMKLKPDCMLLVDRITDGEKVTLF